MALFKKWKKYWNSFRTRGLEEKDYFYSIRLHCSEEEFDNDDFKSTCGVIEMYCTDKADEKEMVELVEKILKGFNETLVI